MRLRRTLRIHAIRAIHIRDMPDVAFEAGRAQTCRSGRGAPEGVVPGVLRVSYRPDTVETTRSVAGSSCSWGRAAWGAWRTDIYCLSVCQCRAGCLRPVANLCICSTTQPSIRRRDGKSVSRGMQLASTRQSRCDVCGEVSIAYKLA